jgi:hypothetical protein
MKSWGKPTPTLKPLAHARSYKLSQTFYTLLRSVRLLVRTQQQVAHLHTGTRGENVANRDCHVPRPQWYMGLLLSAGVNPAGLSMPSGVGQTG